MSDEDDELDVDKMKELASVIDGEAQRLLSQAIFGKLLHVGVLVTQWRDFMITQGFPREWCEEASLLAVRRLLLGLDLME